MNTYTQLLFLKSDLFRSIVNKLCSFKKAEFLALLPATPASTMAGLRIAPPLSAAFHRFVSRIDRVL